MPACKKRKPSIPKDVLEPTEMARVMIDVYNTEAKIQELRIHKDSAKQLYQVAEPYILKQNDTDSIQFQKSIEFYLEYSHEFEDILDIVIDSLSLREQIMKKKN